MIAMDTKVSMAIFLLVRNGDIMQTHSQTAKELIEQGYGCAQSVFTAFCDITGMDRDCALRLASSFGGGMGRLREVCGAVTGMFMVAGILHGYTDPADDEAKAAHYALIQSLAQNFREKHGSYICRELLGLPDGESDPTPLKRTAEYYAARPCGELVFSAAQMLDDWIAERKSAEK